ncbi:MAG: GC-type dockerin domain-anchored protein, partial [Phycisphaerales bacterium JB064]
MRLAALLAFAAAAPAFAQSSPYRLEIRVDRPILEPGETATVELWAWYNDRQYWLPALIRTNVLTNNPDRFGEQQLLFLNGPGTSAGERTDDGIEGILAGSLCLPCADCQWPQPDPVLFWRATLTAPPADFPYEVHAATLTTQYEIHGWGCPPPVSRLDELEEAQATIFVVPCRADLTGDGTLTIADYLAFLNAFDAGEALADFDFDGEL